MSAQLYVLPPTSLSELSEDALMAEAERMRDYLVELTGEMRSRLTPERPERHLHAVEGTQNRVPLPCGKVRVSDLPKRRVSLRDTQDAGTPAGDTPQIVGTSEGTQIVSTPAEGTATIRTPGGVQ